MASNSRNANKVLTRTKGQIGPEIALAAYAKGSEGVWKLKCFLGCVGAASGINAQKFMMTAMLFNSKIYTCIFLKKDYYLTFCSYVVLINFFNASSHVLRLYSVKVMARPRFRMRLFLKSLLMILGDLSLMILGDLQKMWRCRQMMLL